MLKLDIKQNILLRSAEPAMSLSHALEMRQVLMSPQGQDFGSLINLIEVLKHCERLHEIYGEGGLFRLTLLAATASGDLDYFLNVILLIASTAEIPDVLASPLVCDNDQLRAGNDLKRFNSHVLIPSLSRKLYNPGPHHGYLTYGIGGPRILISHQFRGINGEIYDVYRNSANVIYSLVTRGYHGTFLFLDNILGLNLELKGAPGWLLWFSIIATHSDLVLFIRDEHGLGKSQQLEIQYTPDHVQKKIVDIPSSELSWAVEPEDTSSLTWVYGHPEKGNISREESLEFEREYAMAFINQYIDLISPADCFIRHDVESDHVNFYSFESHIYR